MRKREISKEQFLENIDEVMDDVSPGQAVVIKGCNMVLLSACDYLEFLRFKKVEIEEKIAEVERLEHEVEITFEIDSDILAQAREICEREGTTIEVVCVKFLEAIARHEEWAIKFIEDELSKESQKIDDKI